MKPEHAKRLEAMIRKRASHVDRLRKPGQLGTVDLRLAYMWGFDDGGNAYARTLAGWIDEQAHIPHPKAAIAMIEREMTAHGMSAEVARWADIVAMLQRPEVRNGE